MTSVAPTHESLPRIGDIVDKYEVCGEIDSGGMSVIYVARRAGVGGFQKLLAMKVILPNLAREERFKSMFLDEARILSLIQHPNVVPVHDVGETPSGLLYMVMDLLRGRSMARLVRRARKAGHGLRRDIALTILADAAEGLHSAHETRLLDGSPANIVHRDVSPQNIHVSFDCTIRLVDFGIAAGAGRLSQTGAGELKGKLAYVSPEQITGGTVDRRADIWALGVIVWEMLAERRLFGGESEVETLRNVVSMPVPNIALIAKGLGATTAQAVMHCLERDRGRRPPTAKALATALRAGVRTPAGADTREELTSYVRAVLHEDIAEDEERITRAIQAQAPPLAKPARGDDSGPFDVITTSTVVSVAQTPVPPPPRSRRKMTFALLGLAVGLLVAFVAANVATAPSSRSRSPHAATRPAEHPVRVSRPASPAPPTLPTASPTSPAPPDPPEVAPSPAPAPGAREITLVVDPRIAVVRVDGVVEAERPVQIEMTPGQRVRLTAFTVDGDRIDRTLDDATPERLVLKVPPPPPATKTKSPLLGNPYGR